MTGRTALIAGATGLVGGYCLRILLDHPQYERVIVLTRRALGLSHEKLDERVIDFDRLQQLDLPAIDDVYCALGTTIKAAGSREAFLRVDYDYPLALARSGLRSHAKRYLMVTSVAADTKSPLDYLRVKGRLELDIALLPYDSVVYARPSFLMGERSQPRPGERIGIAVARLFEFLLIGPARIYRPIPAETVARALVGSALQFSRGRIIQHYDELRAQADTL